jgi:hypothetical protein
MTKRHLQEKLKRIKKAHPELSRQKVIKILKGLDDAKNGRVQVLDRAKWEIKEIDEKPKDLSFGIKPPISLVPPTFIKQVSRCMEDGAKKRSAYNWRKDPVSAMQLLDKILRHTIDAVDGKDLTEDSQLSNLASAAADIAVYLDALEHGTLVDDRPK